MAGFLVPEWYQPERQSELGRTIATFIWGFSTACGIFAFAKALRQSYLMVSRVKKPGSYVFMVWLELTACIAVSVVAWLYSAEVIGPSLWIYLGFIFLWVIQTQCLSQIIVNRIALIMDDEVWARRLRWGVLGTLGIVNISVLCIWVPARLQINMTYVLANSIWDRTGKAVFSVIDLGLNLYFIFLIWSKFLTNGLGRYRVLFRFNCAMIVLSLLLDGALLGFMFLPEHSVYVQFHPLVYLVKLHIEMNIADLIAKVVQASNKARATWIAPVDNRGSLEPPRCGVCAGVMGMMVSNFGDVPPDSPIPAPQKQDFGAVRWNGRRKAARARAAARADARADAPRESEAVDPLEVRNGSDSSVRQLQRFASVV